MCNWHHRLSSALLSITVCALQAITMVGKEEGLKGYWKGNLPQVYCKQAFPLICVGNGYVSINFERVSFVLFQVIRIIPYSAVQLFAYETYKVNINHIQENLTTTFYAFWTNYMCFWVYRSCLGGRMGSSLSLEGLQLVLVRAWHPLLLVLLQMGSVNFVSYLASVGFCWGLIKKKGLG